MGRGLKVGNEYAFLLGDIYDKTPKAVFAAVAVSALTQGGDYPEESAKRFMDEWKALHDAGIVKQKPIKFTAPTPSKES